MKIKQKNKIYFIIISSIIFILTLLLWKFNVFLFLENKTYDSRIKHTSSFCTLNDNICFIGVDQQSINLALSKNGWTWPWPREAYAQIIEFLTEGDAKSIVMDVLFTEPSVYSLNDDIIFAEACKKSGRVIQTQLYSNGKNLVPIEPIKSASALLGNINGFCDEDGIIRRAQLSYFYDNKNIPSLGMSPLVLNNNVEVKDLDKSMLLHYKGDINRYPHYSAWEIIESFNSLKNNSEPDLKPENFKDSHVFFLFYAPGLYDICATPISKMYPGGGVHITVLDNYLNNDFITKVPSYMTIIFIIIFILISTFIVNFFEKKYFHISNFCIPFSGMSFLLFYIFISYLLMFKNIFIEVLPPCFAFLLTFLVLIFAKYSIEGKQKRFIQNAFSQYLSPKVIEKLIENPEKLKLGGEKRHITIMFSDIESFTSLSENMDPDKLTELLNQYLSEITKLIIESGGTIDKYIGDAVVAFWNAPSDIVNHASIAVNIGLKYQNKLRDLNKQFEIKYGKQIYARIGINTGDAVVGNMGSDLRFDYSMFGDSVNLASRLEGLNKQFGTYCMCSEQTKKEAEEKVSDIYWRTLAKVIVVGKSQPITVYEPITIQKYQNKKEYFDIFEKAICLFYSGDFTSAKQLFDLFNNDKTSSIYSEKCSYFMENKDKWCGCLISTKK